MTEQLNKEVLLKAGPRPTARNSPAAWRPVAHGGPTAQWPGSTEAWWLSPDFPQFFCPAVNSHACTDLHWVWACKSLNSFTILIIISILFDLFFPCMLLSEKRCHSLFICLFTEPDREEVHSQTMQVIVKPQFEIEDFISYVNCELSLSCVCQFIRQSHSHFVVRLYLTVILCNGRQQLRKVL